MVVGQTDVYTIRRRYSPAKMFPDPFCLNSIQHSLLSYTQDRQPRQDGA